MNDTSISSEQATARALNASSIGRYPGIELLLNKIVKPLNGVIMYVIMLRKYRHSRT